MRKIISMMLLAVVSSSAMADGTDTSQVTAVIITLLVTVLFFIGAIYAIYAFGHDKQAVANLTSNRDLRSSARNALSGKWGGAALVVLAYLPFCVLQSLPYVGLVIMLLTGGAFSLGFSIYALKLVRRDDAGVGDLFAGFNDFGRSLGTYLLVTIYIVLWTLLLIIPGILAALSYAMTFYILADHPEMKVNDAIGLSCKLMKGRRWKLFCLGLSFFGWFILVVLTLGIALFWVLPYLWASSASFYEDITRDAARSVGVITPQQPISTSSAPVQKTPSVGQPAIAAQGASSRMSDVAMNQQPPVNSAVAVESSQQSMQGIEDRLYEQIAQEIETNAVDKGLWTKAFAQSGGDDKLTRVAYIKARFEKLMAADNAKFEAMQQEREEMAKHEREEAERIGTLRQRISLRELSASDSVKLKDLWVSDHSANFIARCSWGDLDFLTNSIKENPLFLLVRNGSGSTGLHMAVKNKHTDAAKYLAEEGASVNARNGDGKSPIDLAKETGQADLAVFLQQFSVA